MATIKPPDLEGYVQVHSPTGAEGMIGGVGRVIGHRAGKSRSFYTGEIRDAICGEKMGRDDTVEITGVQRTHLIAWKH